MRLPVITTLVHKGKALELDCERELITIRGPKGEKIGSVTWASIIEQARPLPEPDRWNDLRDEPRLSLVLKVRYTTSGGKTIESRAGGIGAARGSGAVGPVQRGAARRCGDLAGGRGRRV